MKPKTKHTEQDAQDRFDLKTIEAEAINDFILDHGSLEGIPNDEDVEVL